jgi:hypothetical protein
MRTNPVRQSRHGLLAQSLIVRHRLLPRRFYHPWEGGYTIVRVGYEAHGVYTLHPAQWEDTHPIVHVVLNSHLRNVPAVAIAHEGKGQGSQIATWGTW